MQQQRPAPRLKVALEQIGAWVLDQPIPPPLDGQCCDRLRPKQIQRELLQSLEMSGLKLSALVEWRWVGCPTGPREGLALAGGSVAALSLDASQRATDAA